MSGANSPRATGAGNLLTLDRNQFNMAQYILGKSKPMEEDFRINFDSPLI